ncbi:hypothetical protein [Brucella tritici]|uniref:hypothetical protein n=1 Tax=Brucella tritici TaxID=94626 RepID=UPI0015902724|nr:hypothetical protein [Brucella tritici]
MTLRRRIIGDRSDTALWVVSMALVILLQGLVTAYAQASMAAWSADPSSVICSVHSTPVDAEAPLKDLARHCCSTLCQAACAIGTGLMEQPVAVSFDSIVTKDTVAFSLAVRAPPGQFVTATRARGPPSLHDL